MPSVYCIESDTTYPDLASFESAEQGAADKTAVIDGKVGGATVNGWTGRLTLKAKDTPYDGTNSSICDGLNSPLTIRNNNVTLDPASPIFIDGGAASAILLGAFEVVTGIELSGGCKTETGNGSYYGLWTNSAPSGQFDIDNFIVEESGAGVWFRGSAPTSKVKRLSIFQSSQGQGYRSALNNTAGAKVTDSFCAADPTAARGDFYGSSYHADSDFLASTDNTAADFAKTTSYANENLTDVADIAGKDFNIKLTSPLFTAASDGNSIGAVLQTNQAPSNDTSAILSLSNITSITIKTKKLALTNVAINNNTAFSLKSQKAANASLFNSALSTTNINSSKQVSAKVSVNSLSTSNVKCFKQAYGSLTLNNFVVVTVNGLKVVADTRNAVLSLTNQTLVTIKAQKLAKSILSVQVNSAVSIYSQKVSISTLSITNVATVTINSSKVSVDARNIILSLTNQSIVTIKAQKNTSGSILLNNATTVNLCTEKSVNAVLHLQNYATTKITKYSDSYIPVVRRLCIQGQLIRLCIPANINNKLIIQGCF